MRLAHFYHIYCALGHWGDPVAEHLAALDASGYDGPFVVGIVGGHAEAMAVEAELMAIRPPDHIIRSRDGWEQVTLDGLHEHAHHHRGEAVLYAHSKGAGHPGLYQPVWRQSLTADLIAPLAANVARLDEFDTVGSHWLTPEMDSLVTGRHYAGNFWLARTDYLATLSPLTHNSRYDAERWIGTGNPRAYDLRPGWPRDLPRYPGHRLVSKPS